MLPVLTAEEMRRCDAAAISSGSSVLQLMETAAQGALDVLLAEFGPVRGARLLVLCGKGNNGGDGLAFARLANAQGAAVTVALTGSSHDLSSAAAQNYKRVARTKIRRIENASAKEITRGPWDIIVDALLGTGASLPLNDQYRALIRTANQHTAFRLAIDLPTGLMASGEVDPGALFAATVTATLAAMKPGLLFGRGRLSAGRIHVSPVGLPEELLDPALYNLRMIEQSDTAAFFPRRTPDANKYGMGKLFVLSGSRGMMGAATMVARSAMRSGAGITVVGVPASQVDVAAGKLMETMVAGIPETREGSVDDVPLHALAAHMKWADAIAIGPGMSKHADTLATVRAVVSHATSPLVIDADALAAFAEHRDILRVAKIPIVITPHVAELAVLMDTTRDEIILDPIGAARVAAAALQVIVVLKGGPTVIAVPAGIVHVNPTGNPGMATAGAGDVLTGIIGALMAQGSDALEAAICGVYLHGRAGDFAADWYSEPGLTAGDIIDCIPDALQSLPVERSGTAHQLPQ